MSKVQRNRAKTNVPATIPGTPGPWGTPPPQAQTWSIFRDKVRQTYPIANGVDGSEFPIIDLSLELIRERWGHGRFQLYWFAMGEDGRRIPAGRGQPFILHALPGEDDEDEDEEEEEEPLQAPQPPPYALALSNNPLLQSLELLTVITKLKNEEVQGSLNQVVAMQKNSVDMMGLFLQRDTAKEQTGTTVANLVGAIREIGGALTSLQQEMQAMKIAHAQSVATPPVAVSVDEDGLPIEPGDTAADVAKAYAMKKVVQKLPDIVEGMAGMAKMWVQNKADEKQARDAQHQAVAEQVSQVYRGVPQPEFPSQGVSVDDLAAINETE